MSNGTMDVDLLINNGKLVIPAYIISSSIGIKREKIAAIATDLSGFPAKKTIDAKRRTRPGAGRKNGGRTRLGFGIQDEGGRRV